MKKKIILFFIGVVTLAVLLGLQIFSRGEYTYMEEKEEYTGADTRITRAEIARMMSLLKYSRAEIEALPRTITYTDTDQSKWYDKFINAYVAMGFTEAETDDEFHPMAYFTYADCKVLFETIAGQTKDEGLHTQLLALLEQDMDGKKETGNILPEQWVVLYQMIYKDGYDMELTKTPLYFVESWENSDELQKWQTVTDQGVYYGDGLNFLQYLDTKREVFVKDNEILCVGGELEGGAQISNIWILNKEDTALKVFVEGCTRKFELAGDIEEDVSGQVGDLYLEKGKITKVSIKPDKIKGRILVTNDNYIEIENYGRKALSADFCIYRTYGEISMDKSNSLVVGYENAEFVIVGDEICAAIITKPVVAEDIRVLIKTTGFTDYYHDTVSLTADSKYTVSYGEQKKTYKAGDVLTLDTGSELFKEGRVLVKPAKDDGKITLKSIKRNGIAPSYAGAFEIAMDENGLLVINELSIEKYLYAVIPSEMPTTYGKEALKVQAVCARSYAYKQLLANSLRKFGAHVDDSSSYQVYNNIPANKDAAAAVDATCGETITYDGEIITAYYFSTSYGHTADAGEVWQGTTEVPYFTGELQLTKLTQKTEKKFGDLSSETDFKNFLKTDDETYDSESPWYRWKVTIPAKKLKESVNAGLTARYEANPQLIQTKQEDGSYRSVPVDTVGDIKSIEMEARQASGIVTSVIIEGSKNTVRVESEYNIRFLLSPAGSEIVRQDNSKVSSLSMLPSAFFYLKQTDDSYQFTGGGYGHGVGMSQNGAKAMAEDGFSYRQILEHYYNGTTLSVAQN